MRSRPTKALLSLGAIVLLALAAAGSAQAALRWSGLKLIDRAQPFGSPAVINGVSCPTASFCFAIGSQGTVVTAAPGGTPTVVRNGVDMFANLRDVSCPTSSLCVAIEATAVLWTKNPGAAKPIFSKVPLKVPLGMFLTIDCPTASLCVIPASNGTVWTSTRPTGPASAWRATATLATSPRYLNAVSCAPGGGLCVASISGLRGSSPQLATTTSPTAGAAAWTFSPAPSTLPVSAISCPSTGMCVGISADEVLSSANPAAGGSSWTATTEVDSTQTALSGIDCGSASPASCVATAGDGSLVVGSGTPAAPTWTHYASVAARGLTGIACLRGARVNCLAPVQGGGLARVLAPEGVPSTTVAGAGGLTGVNGLSCPSASLCVGVDDAGAVLRTSRPMGPASGWRRTVQPALSATAPEALTGPTGLHSVSCPTVTFCAAVGPQDQLLTSSTPGTAALWRVTTLPFVLEESAGTFTEDLGQIWCTSSALCVSTGSSNRLFVST
ncbi:MAG: hypothetical protein KGL16_13240, partial [Acidobacteriota bacterium]|nr:hypothetical protein [Acidobacteriota bacterium]